MKIQSVAVYCGSSDRARPENLQAARQMGFAIARRGLRLVYGAGSTGLMGALADAVLEANGQVIGIIPELFNTPQLAHSNLTQLVVVGTMHQRKAQFVEMSDAFIAMPGGFGTFEELFEVLTWSQIGLHTKPIGLLNVSRYFDPLLAMVDHAEDEGMIYTEHQDLFVHAESPDLLLDQLTRFRTPTGLERWTQRDLESDTGNSQ